VESEDQLSIEAQEVGERTSEAVSRSSFGGTGGALRLDLTSPCCEQCSHAR